MAIRIQKYGGTSVADIDRINNVANRVLKGYKQGDKMVVVLSAMAGVTDNLIALAKQAAQNPVKRELDVLLATGEQTTASLMAMILNERGYKAKSFLGFQAGIRTNKASGKARIMDIDGKKILDAINDCSKHEWTARRDIALLTLIYGCGLRISEGITIKRKAITLNNFIVIRGKGSKERTVPILPIVTQRIDEYIKFGLAYSGGFTKIFYAPVQRATLFGCMF